MEYSEFQTVQKKSKIQILRESIKSRCFRQLIIVQDFEITNRNHGPLKSSRRVILFPYKLASGVYNVEYLNQMVWRWGKKSEA